jgi:hypothetical protein
MPRFLVRDTFEIYDRKLFVLAGTIVTGVIRPGMFVHIPLNSSLAVTERIHSVELALRLGGEDVCLCLELDPDALKIARVLKIGDAIEISVGDPDRWHGVVLFKTAENCVRPIPICVPVSRLVAKITMKQTRIVGIHRVVADEPVHLIELEVDAEAINLEFGEITQPETGQPRSNWQVAYDLQRLGKNRYIFFFHYLDLSRPLVSPAGPLILPPESPLPDHLKSIEYEQP